MSETEAPQEQPTEILTAVPEPTNEEEHIRYEDDPSNFPAVEGFEPAPTSSEEVPLEASRKDETSILFGDPPKYPEAE